MNIYINDEQTTIDENTSISALLDSMQIESSQGIAIGLNNQVIPATEWKSKILNENDKVLIIRASQGG